MDRTPEQIRLMAQFLRPDLECAEYLASRWNEYTEGMAGITSGLDDLRDRIVDFICGAEEKDMADRWLLGVISNAENLTMSARKPFVFRFITCAHCGLAIENDCREARWYTASTELPDTEDDIDFSCVAHDGHEPAWFSATPRWYAQSVPVMRSVAV